MNPSIEEVSLDNFFGGCTCSPEASSRGEVDCCQCLAEEYVSNLLASKLQDYGREVAEKAVKAAEAYDIGAKPDCGCYKPTCVPCMVRLEKTRRKVEMVEVVSEAVSEAVKGELGRKK